MMFKSKYAAVCEHIAPTPALCEQVLAAMHAEEAAQIPTIVAIKHTAPDRRLWMPLVACAAVALIAVTLGLTLRDSDPLPVAPLPSTTTSASITSTTETRPSTTAQDEAIVPSDDTTSTTTSTTPTTSVSSTTAGTASTTSVTSPTTRPTSATLKSPADHNELLGLMQPFTSATTSSSTDVSFIETTIGSTALPPPTIASSVTSHTHPIYSNTGTASSTTDLSITNSPTTGTTTSAPTHPQGGVVETDTDTTPPLQATDKVVARLEGNTVQLSSADADDPWTATVTPSLPSDMHVADLSLYGDRFVLICRPNNANAPSATVLLLVYELEGERARLVGRYGQDGMYLAAHRVEEVLYLVSFYTPFAIDPSDPATFLPRLYSNETTGTLSPQQIAICKHPVGNAYTVVTAFSLSGSDTFLSATALYGQSNSCLTLSDTAISIRSVSYTDESGKQVYDIVNIPLTKTALFPCVP